MDPIDQTSLPFPFTHLPLRNILRRSIPRQVMRLRAPGASIRAFLGMTMCLSYTRKYVMQDNRGFLPLLPFKEIVERDGVVLWRMSPQKPWSSIGSKGLKRLIKKRFLCELRITGMHVPTGYITLVSMPYRLYWSNMDFHPVSIMEWSAFNRGLLPQSEFPIRIASNLKRSAPPTSNLTPFSFDLFPKSLF
jgi:hypothetical protein